MDDKTRDTANRAKSSARRLRDISHLYLSSGRSQQVRRNRWPAHRLLRLGVCADAPALAKSEVVANFAVQFSKLGRRPLVFDLDPALPNAGFLLGLDSYEYLAHLRAASTWRLAAGVHGVGVVSIPAQASRPNAIPEDVRNELFQSDCLLFNLSADADRNDAILETLARSRRNVDTTTTMSRAGTRSPMFGAWMSTAKGSPRQPEGAARQAWLPDTHLDGLLYLHDRWDEEVVLRSRAWQQWSDAGAFHRMAVNDLSLPKEARPWATLRSLPDQKLMRLPISSKRPKHPSSRMFENLAQALLASLAAPASGRGDESHA